VPPSWRVECPARRSHGDEDGDDSGAVARSEPRLQDDGDGTERGGERVPLGSASLVRRTRVQLPSSAIARPRHGGGVPLAVRRPEGTPEGWTLKA